MIPINGGKTHINPFQIVMATEDKGGDTWTVQTTDDKQFKVSKADYETIRAEVTAIRKLRLVIQALGDTDG